MSKFKLGVIGVLSLLALLATMVGPSSASAAFVLTENKCVEGKWSICWDLEKGTNLRELTGEETFEALLDVEVEGEEHLFKVSLGGEELHIECVDAHVVGTVDQTAPLVTQAVLLATVTFTECKLLEPLAKKCKIQAIITTNKLVGTPTSEEAVSFVPETGTAFVTFTLSNSTETCPATIAGNRNVTGEQVCLLITPKEDLKDRLLWCPEEDSNLRLGGSEILATLLSDFLLVLPNLEVSDAWDIALA
jgi:hypothetical protein